MMNRSRILFAGFLATILCSCSDSTVNQEEEANALMELSRQWSAVVASGDMETGLNFWADDAVMLPPDLPVIEGKPAIRDYIEGAANIPGFKISWEPEMAYVSQSGDLAYLIEKNVTEFDDEQGNHVVIPGKVVTIWRKDSKGDWKNVVDMWNAVRTPTE